MGRVSVPFWLIVLSDQLPVIVLVGYYPTNKLIGRRTLPTVPMQDNCWDSVAADPDSDLAGLESDERRRMIRLALDKLPPDQAALISLSHFEELSADQIAAILEKPSAQAVRAALHRAMQNLRKVLLQQGYFTPVAL